jgi:ribonuclease D
VNKYRIVDSPEALSEVVDAIGREPRIALDTEFHRERTYWPKVALVQIAWPGELVLIDPLAIDLTPLAAALGDETLVVAHAAAQDLEVLELSCGRAPARLFDTQIAAGFLGMTTPSLAALHERELGIQLPKSSRLTDWLVRPLDEGQLDYAAADVGHLLEIHDRLLRLLEERGRLDWAEAEFAAMLARNRGPRDPDEAWRRIKEARHLRGSAISIARSVAAWRERRAAEIDQPPRFVLADLAVVAVSQAAPRTAEDLERVRGIDRGVVRGQLGEQILEAVKAGLTLDWRPPRLPRRGDDARELRPAVALVAAWVNQTARDRDIDPSLLATRADVEALVRGDDDARLASGWRAEMAGGPIRRLVAGDAALAFENGSVVLEERSNRPIS